MIKKILFGMAIALVIAGVTTQDASALCNPPKTINTYNGTSGAYAYWHFTGAPGQMIGNWSAGGATNTSNTGPCAVGGGYFGLQAGTIGVSMNLGDACVSGCPSGNMRYTMTHTNATGTQFITVSASEGATIGTNYDFAPLGDQNMVAFPRPRVATSSRAGSLVNLTINIDSTAAGFVGGTGSSMQGWNVLSAQSATDPGRLASAYTQIATCGGAAGAAVSGCIAAVTCSSTATDQWVVLQQRLTDGNDKSVGPATRIECDPALADPKHFKIIDKKGGPKTIKAN